MFVPAVCWIPTWSPWISRRSWLEQKGRGVVLRRVVVLPAIGPLPCRQGHNPLVGYSAVTGCVSWGFARCSNFHQVPIFPIWALVALLWFWLWNWLRHMDAWGIWTAFGFSCSNDLAFWCALSNIRHYIEMYSCLACVIFHCKKLKEEIHIWCWDIFRFSGCGFFHVLSQAWVSNGFQNAAVCACMQQYDVCSPGPRCDFRDWQQTHCSMSHFQHTVHHRVLCCWRPTVAACWRIWY